MFFFKKKYSEPLDLSWLGTDLHSHLVPGIDDGSPEHSTSVEMIRGLVGLGYKKIITTPHVLWEVYPNTSEIILSGLEDLKKSVANAGINVELGAAAEYFIDEHFDQELKTKQPLLTLKDNLVLVEFSMLTAPLDLQDVIFEMQLQGYQPIIAHPERYIYLRNRKSFFDELKDIGCHFQINLLSITGHYGTSVRDLAEYLIQKKYYDYAGTDMHHLKHLEGLQKLNASPLYEELKNTGNIKNYLL